jgi:hypothetical protein
MKIIRQSIIAVSILFAAVALSSVATRAAFAPDGEKLERQMWEDMKAKNWTAVVSRIAPDFQSVHPDGARDRAGELALIKNLNLGDYTLADFKVTDHGNTIVVSYTVAVAETIDKTSQSTKPAPRLSVWQKGDKGWQWIAHANLNQ